jgi:ribosomal protein S18 acetylase RimI-like enzyme
MSTVMLYVDADNIKAMHTYRDFGFVHWDTDVCYTSNRIGT